MDSTPIRDRSGTPDGQDLWESRGARRLGGFWGGGGIGAPDTAAALEADTRMGGADDGDDGGTAEQWQRDAECTEEEDAQGDEAADTRPAHQQLWEELQAHRADLKIIRRQWPEGHWAVVAAQQKVDATEEAWRNEKPLPPPSRALLRAEQAVRKAEARASDLESKIGKLEAEYRRKRSDLELALAEETTRLEECRTALAHAQEAVGAEGRRQSDGAGGLAEGGMVRAAVSTLETDVAPQLAALLEGLDSTSVDDELKQAAQALNAKLHSMHAEMSRMAEMVESGHGHSSWGWSGGHSGSYGHHYSYDIGDGDSLPELSDGDWNAVGAQNHYANGGWGGYAGGWHDQWYSQHYRQQWYDPHAWDDAPCDGPPNKKGRADDTAAMEEQQYEEMQVPGHITTGASPIAAEGPGATTPQPTAPGAASAGQAADAEASRTALQAQVAEFQAAASARGVDISDVDLCTITAEQLQLLAVARLG